MGYRTYIAIIEKKKLNALRKCNSIDDVVSVFEKYGWSYDKASDDCPPYCPVYNLDYIAEHEFGKYYENNYEEFYKLKKRVFKNKDLDKNYDDYNFEYGGIKLLELAIDDYRLRVEKYFKNMCSIDSFTEDYKLMGKTDEEKKEMHYNALVHEFECKVYRWSGKLFGSLPYNMDKKTNKCVDSWLYEYEIFDLVRMYKLFDEKKHYVVYFGY